MVSLSTLRNQTLAFRRLLRRQLEEAAAQADLIPPNANNNLRWQAGHLVLTPQLLTYGRLGEPIKVPQEYRQWFGRGTSPHDWKGQPVPPFHHLLEQVVDKTAALFDDFERRPGETLYPEPWHVIPGAEFRSVADALAFSFGHDGIHAGHISALRRSLP